MFADNRRSLGRYSSLADWGHGVSNTQPARLQPGGPGSHTDIPRNRVAQLYPRALGSLFCRLLRLAGQRWRYSDPPPESVRVRVTVSQSVCLGVEPNLGLLTRDFFFWKLQSCLILGRPLWREVGSPHCNYSYRNTRNQALSMGDNRQFYNNNWNNEYTEMKPKQKGV
jgi:hypothetical protein